MSKITTSWHSGRVGKEVNVVRWGEVGTPVLVGIQGGLGGTAFNAQLAEAGLGMSDYLRLVTSQVVVLHAIAGVLMPTWMVVMLTRFFGACDARESASEPDWEDQKRLIEASRTKGLDSG